MAVHYITVTPVTNLFKPATRSFGDIAIVGDTDANAIGPTKTPLPITNPDSISYTSKTTLSEGIGDGDSVTEVSVTSIAGLPSGPPFTIRIDNEVLAVTAINSKKLTVTRGEAGTTKTVHAIGALVIYNPDIIYTAETTLSAGIDAKATTVPVDSIVGLPSGPSFTIRIDREVLAVTAISAGNLPAGNLTVSRGATRTTATPHAKGASVVFTVEAQSVESLIWFKGSLGSSVRKAFEQTPGPTTVWAVRTDPADGDEKFAKALAEVVANLDVQIVALANTPLESATQGRAEIETLSSHVNTVSNKGGDGKERIGVAMLGKDVTDLNVVTSNMSNARMIMVAHKSTEDAAAAVAGTIAGYEPHISLLLKQVNISMDSLFSDSQIVDFDKARVNWLIDPPLIPGKGLFMGEGYTLGADIPYIDIIRTIDDISFRLKAQLIRSIGDLRVSRSGLRTLVSQMTAVLEPLKQREVIESYDVFLPLLVLLDKEPASLSDAELQQIHNVRNARTVDAIISVKYAGAIHRLNITLKFE